MGVLIFLIKLGASITHYNILSYCLILTENSLATPRTGGWETDGWRKPQGPHLKHDTDECVAYGNDHLMRDRSIWLDGV